jgi:AAA family ATP:ADP antiporter
VLPALMIISYSAMALLPILAVVRFAMVTENSLAYSLQSTTRHALFLPVSREEKYVGKHAIDTFFFRFGDVLSAGFVFAAGGVLGWGIGGFIGINVGLAVCLTLLSLRIGRYNKVVIKQHPENLPPVIHRNIENLLLPAGQLTHFELEEELFSDPDEGDALKYLALAGDGERLPAWIKFDGLSRRFTFSPPAASSGELLIRVVARDFDGLEASIDFTVSYH